MPGRPKLFALKKRIAEDGLEDEIFEAIAEGLSIANLCTKFQITSRKMFYDWKGKEGPRQDKYTAARLIAGEVHAEKAGEILDKLDDKLLLTGPEVQAAVARSKYQQWLASVKDRDQFGTPDQGATINLSFGDLHMAALKSPGARPQIEAPEPTLLIPVEEPTTGTFSSLIPVQEAEFEQVGEAGNDGEADAQLGKIDEPISSPVSLAPELSDLL